MNQSSPLLINESPLSVLPTLATYIGLEKAIILQQIQYWAKLGKNIRDGHNWVYNTYAGWHEQMPFFSERAIRRYVSEMEAANPPLIVSTDEYNEDKWNRRKWYRINYDALAAIEVATNGGSSSTPEAVADLGQPDAASSGNVDAPVQAASYKETKTTQETTQETSPAPTPKASRRAPKVPIPEDFVLTEERISVATGEGLSVEQARLQFRRFQNSAIQNDRVYANWDMAWSNWILGGLEKGWITKASSSQPKGQWWERLTP